MSAQRTLATSITVYAEGEPVEQQNVPVEVFADLVKDGPAYLWFGHDVEGQQVRVELNGAERIALIEALGGTRG